MNFADQLALAQRDPHLYALHMFVIGSTNAPIDNVRNVIALRVARSMGHENEVRQEILRRRREWLTRHTVLQRHWQTKTSRRPQRGRHHDSWSIREGYVRCAA